MYINLQYSIVKMMPFKLFGQIFKNFSVNKFDYLILVFLLNIYRSRNSKCQYLLGKKLFWWKYLLGPMNNKKNRKFKKIHISRVPGASKVLSNFPTYFSIEDSLLKNFFAPVISSTKKYFKKKTSEKYALPGKKIDFFVFSCTNFICNLKKVIQPKGHVRFCSGFFFYYSPRSYW